MFFKQFYLGCLAHGSYFLGSQGEAAVIDPQRDVEQYIEEAQTRGYKIKYIIETHLHADFVSGHRELADRTGAQIVFGAKANAEFNFLAAHDGDVLKVGDIELKILETPGHTPESICIVAVDSDDESAPAKLFSGDTLFIGDVGRPDLVAAKGFSKTEMASMLYDSLHSKLSLLDDETEIYPAHGAGSLCGKHLSDERSSTIGVQKRFNRAFNPDITRDEFIRITTSDLPEVPAYFPKDAELNRQGAVALSDLPRPKPLSASAVKDEMKRGAILLDIRNGHDFAGEFVRGALNIGLSGQFASWAGTLIELGTPIILLADDDEKALDEAVMRLARIGIESVIGFLDNGVDGWRKAGFEVSQSSMIDVADLKKLMETPDAELVLLDVRRIGEYRDAHVPGAVNIPLAELPKRIGEIAQHKKIAVICASGYRSSIAVSLLAKAVSSSLLNVVGGMSSWKNHGLDVEKREKVLT